MKKITGIIAATFTPMRENGGIDLEPIGPITDFLVRNKIEGLYVCGSTGEGPLMTGSERMLVAEKFIEAAHGRIPVVVSVGHDSVQEATELAAHAVRNGADAVAAVAPAYFKCSSIDNLIDCMVRIADAAVDAPFYYYHVPSLTGFDLDIVDFLERAAVRIPNLAGIKYCALKLHEFQSCVDFEDGRYSMLFGVDEMFTSGLIAGAWGAVGSTFNFAPGLYRRIRSAFQSGDIALARQLQSLSIKLIRIGYRYHGQPAFKSIMRLHGYDCGPNRLPHRNLSLEQFEALKLDLEAIGFFDWALEQPACSEQVRN